MEAFRADVGESEQVKALRGEIENLCMTAYYECGMTGLRFVAMVADSFDTLEAIDPFREK